MGLPSGNACKKWCTVLGSLFLNLPLGVEWFWGNMSVYALSYVVKHMPSSSNVESPWVFALSIPSGCLGMFASALMTRFCGKRLTVIVGIGIFSAGWVGVYFAIQTSLIAIDIVIGLVINMSAFLADGPVILYVVEWCQDDVGFVSAIVRASLAIGAIGMNQFVTLYVNPNNELPDKYVGPSKYFSQDEVVKKVPSVFLILAGAALVVNLLGLLLMRQNPDVKSLRDTSPSETSYYDRNGTPGQQVSPRRDCESVVVGEKTGQTEADRSKTPTPAALQSTDLSPGEVIRTYDFYLLTFLFLMALVSYILVGNYFKAFGQLYILDDHFLTKLSTAILVVVTISRFLWGAMLDRCGLKYVLILFFSGCGILSFCFYFSALMGKRCFAVVSLVFACFWSPQYVIFFFAIMKTFGKQHFLFNFGLVMLPTLAPCVAMPPLIDYLLLNFGWFYVFAFCSVCKLFGLLAVIFMLTEKEKVVA